MNKILTGLLLVGLTTLVADSYKVGNTYYHSDGSSSPRVGNSVYGTGLYYGY